MSNFVPVIQTTYSTRRIKFDVENFEPTDNDFGSYDFPEKQDLRTLVPRSEREPIRNLSIRSNDFVVDNRNPENYGRTIQLVQDDGDVRAFLDTQPRDESQQTTEFGQLLNAYLNDDTLEKRTSGEETIPTGVTGDKNINSAVFGYTGGNKTVSVSTSGTDLQNLKALIDAGFDFDADFEAQLKILGGLDPNSSSPINTLFVSWCLWRLGIPALKTGASQDYRKWGKNVPWQDFTQIRENDIVILENRTSPGAGVVGFYQGFNSETEKIRIIQAGSNTPQEYSAKKDADLAIVAVRRNWLIAPTELDKPLYYN